MDAGELPDFLPETKAIRDSDWKIADIHKTCSIAEWRSPDQSIAR
jgi:hypothetical protein